MNNKSIDPLKLSEQYWRDIPVPVFKILRELGLGAELRKLPDDVSGWIEKLSSGDYWVVINENHARVRQRFTAAHELAHYIYHRDLLGNGVGDTRAYRAENSPMPNSAIRPVHERQANSFAANLLMPQHSIMALQAQGVTSTADLAERLGVSQEAMRIRLGHPRP